MENKNTLIGTILLGLLVAGMFYFQSKTEVKPEEKKLVETTKATEVSKSESNNEAVETLDSTVSEPEIVIEEKLTTLENSKMRVTLSNKGGRVTSVELKEYKTWDKKPLILFTENSNKFGYTFTNNAKSVSTQTIYFDAENPTVNSVTYKTAVGEGKTIEQSYVLKENEYTVDYILKVNGINQPISLDWKSELLNLEHAVSTERNYSALYFKYQNDKVDHLDEAKDQEQKNAEKDVEWISFKQQFFNATLITPGSIAKADFSTFHDKDKTNYVKKYQASGVLKTKDGKGEFKMKWFFGPNRFGTLKESGNDLQEIIKLSPDNFIFSWIKYITRIFTLPTFNILESVGLNYGIIILVLTIILKLLLTPLTWSSIKSSAYMKVLKPEIDGLKEKYGDDQQKISAEQMKIYQQAGVNPFGGCLPMLLQLPILMSMYYFFPNSIELRQQPFLWATDLSSYDAIYTFKEAIFGLTHISLFTVLMTITSIAFAAYTQMNSGMTNTQPGMQYLPYIMPLFLMFMFNSFPAALTYYYLLQNVISMAQQWFMQKFFINESALIQKIEHNKKNPKPASKWQQKLSEIQQQQQAQQKKK
jgi:YidC/Oxa1 family membrane protein insertase